LERLALLRNPTDWIWRRTPAHDLLKKIFDHTDHDLGISLEERKELIGAFLANREAIAILKERPSFGDTQRMLPILWELSSKWPKSPESEVRRKTRPVLMPHYVYYYLPVDDETRSRIYQKEDDANCRHWILESCTPDDVQTIALGKKDKDKQCRELARSVARKPEMPDKEYFEKQAQEMAGKAKYRQEVMTFFTRLGIALIAIKLYFPEWSNLALGVSVGFSGILIAVHVSDHVVRHFQKKKERRESSKAIAQVYLDADLDKARDLLEKGLSPSLVSEETGLSLKILKREGLVS
jgi:hypothetical protein